MGVGVGAEHEITSTATIAFHLSTETAPFYQQAHARSANASCEVRGRIKHGIF